MLLCSLEYNRISQCLGEVCRAIHVFCMDLYGHKQSWCIPVLSIVRLQMMTKDWEWKVSQQLSAQLFCVWLTLTRAAERAAGLHAAGEYGWDQLHQPSQVSFLLLVVKWLCPVCPLADIHLQTWSMITITFWTLLNCVRRLILEYELSMWCIYTGSLLKSITILYQKDKLCAWMIYILHSGLEQ